MVTARIIVVVAVAVALSSSAAGETQADCLNRCIGKCVDSRGGLCSFNCANGCNWPFSQPTGEVLVTRANGGQDPIDAAATQAVFAMHEEPTDSQGTQPAPPPTASQNPNQTPS